MPLKTFLATVEVRIVVDVPEDFTNEDFNNGLEIYTTSNKGNVIKVNDQRIEDIELIECDAEEHTDEDAEA